MKTEQIVQHIALVITLGVAASANAQLLGGGGRGGIGGSIGGMVGGAGNIGGGMGAMTQMPSRGSMSEVRSATQSVTRPSNVWPRRPRKAAPTVRAPCWAALWMARPAATAAVRAASPASPARCRQQRPAARPGRRRLLAGTAGANSAPHTLAIPGNSRAQADGNGSGGPDRWTDR